jgi:Flp pilus assembly protein TadD
MPAALDAPERRGGDTAAVTPSAEPRAQDAALAEAEAAEAPEEELAAEPPALDEPASDSSVDELLRAAARAGSSELAERLYRRVLALDPREHHAMVGLAEILMERNAPAEAVELLRGAVSRRPRRAAYRIKLGDALAAVGDAAGARRAWHEALELEPDNAQARRRLGQ